MDAGTGISFSYEKVLRGIRSTFSVVLCHRISEIKKMQKAFVICFVVLIAVNSVTSRWLPTRAQEDRLEKLKEMLRELLETESERQSFENKNIFKREVGTQVESIVTAESGGKVGMKERLR